MSNFIRRRGIAPAFYVVERLHCLENQEKNEIREDQELYEKGSFRFVQTQKKVRKENR